MLFFNDISKKMGENYFRKDNCFTILKAKNHNVITH